MCLEWKLRYFSSSKRPFMRIAQLLWLLTLATTLLSCSKEYPETQNLNDPATAVHNPKAVSATLSETFEAGTKTAYAAANVTFSTGSWYLNNALVGNTTSDRKFNTKSIRVQTTGTVKMNFNATNGAGTVSIYHALYGTDPSATWELWYSVNNGTSWSKAGSTITTATTTLTQATFSLNITGNVRFEIRKISSAGRINFDNFTITDNAVSGPTKDDNLGMGNPSNATTIVTNANNYLVVKPQFALSYNNSRGTANWVSWHLSTAWLGSANSSHSFTTDNTLPATWYWVKTSDYTNSGFDRGHMCPAADRSLNSTDNTATYVMTNVSPQAPNLNQITWNSLEGYCRTLAGQGNEMYIVDGVLGTGGTGSNGGTTNSFASGKVTVPAKLWKSILILPNGSNDVSRVSNTTRIITVMMPNTQLASSMPWGTYRVSVDYLETQTTYNLWPNVPAAIQAVIEASVDAGPVN
jgi:endonuclease G